MNQPVGAAGLKTICTNLFLSLYYPNGIDPFGSIMMFTVDGDLYILPTTQNLILENYKLVGIQPFSGERTFVTIDVMICGEEVIKLVDSNPLSFFKYYMSGTPFLLNAYDLFTIPAGTPT